MPSYGYLRNIRLKCEIGVFDAILFVLVWLVIAVVTLGIGTVFAFYYFYNAIIDKTYVTDRNGEPIARLECDLQLTEIIGHIVIWIVIGFVTLGIGFLVFHFMIFRMCLNRTIVVPKLVREDLSGRRTPY